MEKYTTLEYAEYVSEGFKALRCKGYHPMYNPEKDYKLAKVAIDADFTKEDFTGLSLLEVAAWEKTGGWIGWVIPKGYMALDAEGDYKITLTELICQQNRIDPSMHKSNEGKHYLFKLKGDLPASSSVYTRCGLELTYRVGGKNYLILAPTNGRSWERGKSLEKLPELPEEFMPYDSKNPEDALRVIACQIGQATYKGMLNGYEDIDSSFMALLIDREIPPETIKETFKLIFQHEYDEQRTEYMYGRTVERLQSGEEVRGGASFIQKIREIGLTEIEALIKKLDTKSQYISPLNEKSFVPKLLADELMSEYSLIYTGEQLYVYQEGVYKPCKEDFIKKECRKRLGTKSTISRIKEVIAHIIDLRKVDAEEINKQGIKLINLKNGMLDWRTGELLPHDKGYLSTIRIPVRYDPEATCPTVDAFLESTLPADCIELIEEIIGYCLIPDVSFDKAIMLVGSGANGKSTFLNLLGAVLGFDNVSTIPLQEICDHRFKRAGLFGKLANIFTDVGSRALLDSGYFKAIVSGDSIDAEQKFKTPFNFRPHVKLLFSANEMPKSGDRTHAFYRRWIIVPFPNTFMGRDADRSLIYKMLTPKGLSGLLNRAVRGLRRLFKNSCFSENATTSAALNEYRKENDSIVAFIEACCEFDKGFEIGRKELFGAYETFCNDEGAKQAGKKNFNKVVRGLKHVKEQSRIFKGIRVKEEIGDDSGIGQNQ